jgi:hypothetical protein
VSERAGGTLGFLLFALMVVALSVLLTWRFTPEFFSAGAMVDPDGYMRLVRVRLLAEGGGWFDTVIARSNWPVGEVHHWSRPLDVIILAGAWILTPLAGFEGALHVSGLWVTTVLLVALFAVTAWASEPVVGRKGRGFAMLVLLAQPAVMAYALPGRADHHALILLCFAVSLGFALRGLVTPERRAWAWGLGVSCGTGLWVSTEFLLPLAFYLGVGMALWMRLGASAAFQRRWTGALLLATAGAVLLERGPGALAVEYDRVSVVHVLVALLAFGVWVALEVWQARRDRPVPSARRLAAGLVAGLAALAIMGAVFPPFFRGPMVEVTDPVTRAWLASVSELQPVLLPVDLAGLGLLLANAGSALLALGFLAHRGWRRRHGAGWGPAGGPLVLLGVGMAGCLALALAQVRWVTYVQVLSAPALAVFIVGIRRALWPEARLPTRRLLARASMSAALVAGPLLTGAILFSFRVPADDAVAADTPAPKCDFEAMAAWLGSAPPFGEAPRTVAAYTDLGPVLLYRTHHRVLATAYHRNQRGIRTVSDLINAVDETRARELMRASEIDLILLCPHLDRALFTPLRDGRATLYGRLLEGNVPDWLDEVGLPDALAGFRLFQFEEVGGVADPQRSGQSARFPEVGAD